MLVQKPEALKLIMRRSKNIEDLLRPREKWEQNEHCLRSIGFRQKPKRIAHKRPIQTQRSERVLSNSNALKVTPKLDS